MTIANRPVPRHVPPRKAFPNRHRLTSGTRAEDVFGSASKLRPLVVPPTPPAEPDSATAGDSVAASDARPPTHRSRYRPWAELMKRTFAVDVEKCSGCGGRLKLVRFVTRAETIEKILAALGEPTDAPRLSPARDPPFYKSRLLRRRRAIEPPQRELFAE
jgi:hypothetical protein